MMWDHRGFAYIAYLKNKSGCSHTRTLIRGLSELLHFLFFNIWSDICSVESFVSNAHLFIPKSCMFIKRACFFFFSLYEVLLIVHMQFDSIIHKQIKSVQEERVESMNYAKGYEKQR